MFTWKIIETCQSCNHEKHQDTCGYVGFSERWVLKDEFLGIPAWQHEYPEEDDFDVFIDLDDPCDCEEKS